MDFSVMKKLVAETYDCAEVTAGEHNGLQKLIRDKQETVLFVNCYTRQLNLLVRQLVEYTQECKVFFETSGFSEYFFKSSKRLAAFDTLATRRMPSVPLTRWFTRKYRMKSSHS
jgi:hypothetical protein